MGNSKSKSQKKHRRRSSVHSGRLYIDTQSFNQSASEVKESLPEDLKIYCNSIEILYRFWCTEIETLSPDDYKQSTLLLYMNVFAKFPDARKLFKKNIELQAKQFFGMIRWIIANLHQPGTTMLIKRIKTLGNMHKKIGIEDEWYELLLQAFHDTMIETTKEKYTPRIRFCMEQLYTVVMNIMTGKDFESLSSANISQLLKSLDTLQNCLADKNGRSYLKLYMKQTFCVELMLFYEEYRKFKAAVNKIQRQKIGQNILEIYIGEQSQCAINVSYKAKRVLYSVLKNNDNVFTPEIFDQCAKETVRLMETNRWIGFKTSILRIAVDNDKNYEKNVSLNLMTPSNKEYSDQSQYPAQ